MNKDKTIPKLWDNKVDKGGYTGTAQNLKSEIDSKINKSGDTMTGVLTVKAGGITISSDLNPALRVVSQDSSTYLGFFGYDNNNKNASVSNEKAQIALKLFDNGNTTIDAKNLLTQSKEVIAAVNELKSKLDIQQLPYLEDIRNINDAKSPGSYYYGSSGLNTPSSYGQLLCFVNNGLSQDNSSNWLSQLALGTNLEVYFRQKINDSDFTGWVKLLHTGNTKPVGAYTNIIIPSTSLANPAEYISNTTWTRIGEQNVGGTTVYYWKRNS